VRTSRRIYDRVAIRREADGFRILLGGKPLRTPAGAPLALATAALAAAVANEWLAQGETLRPETMPLTRLAATAIDRVAAARGAVVDAVVSYAGSDMLCYRAAAPDELMRLQYLTWQPLVEWAAEGMGAQMAVVAGILPVAQPDEAVAALRRAVEACDDLELTALATLAQAAGSLITGLAVLHKRIDAETACAVALLDECWQASRWGSDAEAEGRWAEIRADIRAASLFLALSAEPASIATSGAARAAGQRS